jgi:hypothetical protein
MNAPDRFELVLLAEGAKKWVAIVCRDVVFTLLTETRELSLIG